MSAKTFFSIILRQIGSERRRLLQNQPVAAAQIGGACYNNIGGCAASTQIGPQTHAMTLKKVLADTKTLFQMIPKRQRNLIRHNEDRAGKKLRLVRGPEFPRTLSKPG